MARFATVTGNLQDAENFQKEAAAVKEAFNKRYFNPEVEYYSNNTVTANILSLRFGMVPEQYKKVVFQNSVE